MDIPKSLTPKVQAFAATYARSQALAEQARELRAQRSACDAHLSELENSLLDELDALGPYATFFADNLRLDVTWGRDAYGAQDMAEVPAAFVRKTRNLDKKRARILFGHLADVDLPSWLTRERARNLSVCEVRSGPDFPEKKPTQMELPHG